VLHGNRGGLGRQHTWKRWLGWAVACAIFGFVFGCQRVSDHEWETRYDKARKELWYGYFEDAYRDADRNYHTSATASSAWSWRFQLLKAQALEFQGKNNEALHLLEPGVPAGAPLDVRVRKSTLQAEALCRLGEAQRAKAYLVDANSLLSDDLILLRAELALTMARCALPSDPAAAKKSFAMASVLAHDRDEFIEAAGLLNLGFTLLRENQYDRSIAELRKGITVTSSPLLQGRMLGSLGFAYSQTGDFRRALWFSQRAEDLANETKNKEAQRKWLIDLGREHSRELENAEADAAFKEALTLAKEQHDDNDMAICLNNLTQLSFQIKDLTKAEDYIRQLAELKPTGTHNLDLLVNRAELAIAKKEFSSAEELLRQVLGEASKQQGVDPYTVWSAQSDLATVFVSQGKFAAAEGMFRAALATVEATRSKIEGVEYRLSFLDYGPFYDEYVRFLVSRNRPLDALAIAEQGRSPTLSEGLSSNGRSPRIDIARIQGLVKQQGHVVLAYWLAAQESYLWIITPTHLKLIHLPAELELQKEIDAYNREIIEGGTLESLRERGQRLYGTLVGPAEPYLSKGSTVIILPHRKLYNLAFETLVVPGPSPHYWIEDAKSENVSFLNALLSARPRSPASKDLLVLGAPLLADKQFPVLQYASAEMEKVAAHFAAQREAVISGKDATPAAYLASHPGQYRYIHLVTHGTSSTVTENPLDAAIILSPVPGNTASAADPGGSYRLYGKDIMKTPLQADLVIISACYGTGREYSGEGLVGLAWAFLRAGAHQVIAALWEVDDASMPQLMDDFYGEYTHDKSATEALRDAKLRMLHSNDFHKRPYYWASLQLYTGS
jgi:CHAT domain-containing protein